MKLLTLACLLFCSSILCAQVTQFPAVSAAYYSNIGEYPDKEANAVVLLETGKTHLDISDQDNALRVFHNYKARIKILSQEGFDQANITIPLYAFGKQFEYVTAITGKTYNLENGRITETLLDKKNIITENQSEFLKLTKVTLPNIQIGSIIEIEYSLVSPDIMNFRSWQFQTDIPKIRSEYNVRIPAITNYNVTLKGGGKLENTKSKRENDCFVFNGQRIACSNITYSMNSIPAFQEEAFMLAAKNYIAAINFELVEIANPRGGVDKFTKAWKDVDQELMSERNFGGQLKKVDYFKELMEPAILEISNPTLRATAIYRWINKRIRLSNVYGKFAQHGVEQAFQRQSGNIGDINLAFIAALQAADLEAYPVIISTRNNGLPHDLHPILTDFNYVIAAIKINDNIILADATDPLLSFGQLPLHCINGRGRIIYSRKSSEWIDLTNPVVSYSEYRFNGKLGTDGKLTGSLFISSTGLDALNKRKDITSYPSTAEYVENMDEKLTHMRIQKSNFHELDNPEQSLTEEYEVEIKLTDTLQAGRIQLNPIFISRIVKNPFNLDERNYAVDLGAQNTDKHSIEIELPKGMTLINAPKNINMALPQNSARFYYSIVVKDEYFRIHSEIRLNKAIYSSDEYFALKELFSRIIQHMQIDYEFNYQPE